MSTQIYRKVLRSLISHLSPLSLLFILLFASCGDSDELTPEVVTFAGEAIELPSPPYLTNDERDQIEMQRNAVKEAIANYSTK